MPLSAGALQTVSRPHDIGGGPPCREEDYGFGAHDGPWLVLKDGDIADVAECKYEAKIIARSLADIGLAQERFDVIEIVPAALHLS